MITREFEDADLLFTEQYIISAIDDIKADAAAGPDGIPTALLKPCKHGPSSFSGRGNLRLV